MSILIKGMDKPTCYNCFARGNHYCRLLKENDSVWEYVTRYETSPYCPLVEVNEAEQTEPQTCSVNGRPYSECADCGNFRCMADEPQTDCAWK